MKKQKLKTITIGTEDGPLYSLCPGHVDAKTFARAHKAEGWSGDACTNDQLAFEYWIKTKRLLKRSLPGRKGAVPFTVLSW